MENGSWLCIPRYSPANTREDLTVYLYPFRVHIYYHGNNRFSYFYASFNRVLIASTFINSKLIILLIYSLTIGTVFLFTKCVNFSLPSFIYISKSFVWNSFKRNMSTIILKIVYIYDFWWEKCYLLETFTFAVFFIKIYAFSLEWKRKFQDNLQEFLLLEKLRRMKFSWVIRTI